MANESRKVALLLTALAAAIASGSAHAFRVDYQVDLGVERNDNLFFTPDNKVRTTILRPGLGFVLTEESSTWQAEFSGRAEYLHYQEGGYDDNFEGVLAGRLNWVAIPERLHFTLEDNLSVQPVDVLRPDVPDNRQQINVLSVGPTLFFDIGRTLKGAASVRYINSRAEVTDEFNSDRLDMALSATKEFSTTTQVSGHIQAQRVDFEDDTAARDFDRSNIFGRYTRTLASFDVAVDAGLSRISFRGGDSRSSPLFRVQGTWRPTSRHALGLSAASEYSDSAIDALGGIGPGTSVRGGVVVGDSVVSGSPFKERSLEATYDYNTTRANLMVASYYNQLRYVETSDFDQNNYGIRGEFNWQLRPRFEVGVFGSYGQVSYERLDRKDKSVEVGLQAGYAWGQHLSSHLRFTRYDRILSVGQDTRQNVLEFVIAYRNR